MFRQCKTLIKAKLHRTDVVTVDSRYLDFDYLELPLISKRKSGPCVTSGNKILRISGEIAPEEQFLPFSTIFLTYISN